MTNQTPTLKPSSPACAAHWLASRRRRTVVTLATLLVIVGVALGVTDPFAGAHPTAGSDVADSEYPTSTATVARETLSSQTEVSATLGYAGSYTVSLPSGTSASTITEQQATVQADETKVAEDETTLADAKSAATPSNASTLLSARAAVDTDETTLEEAKAQLSSDEHLSCPASSSATVTTAASGSSSPSGDDDDDNSGTTGDDDSNSPSGTTGTGNSGTEKANLANLDADITPGSGNTGTAASAPSATTGSVDETTSTSTELTGSVDPDGATTTYYFEYGTSPNYGETTTSSDVGSGSSDVSITASLTGLTAGATYYYRLVAVSSLGTDYGQSSTFSTNAVPVATTGVATTVSATSESLAGTVTPNGADTSYYFEWGTSAAFGHKSAASDAGAGTTADSVSATITGLKPATTYDFALVATSALGTSRGTTTTFQTAASSCVAERTVISEDSAALSEAKDTLAVDRLDGDSSVTSDEQTLASDQASLASAEQALSADKEQAANSNTTFTALPKVGQVITRGESVYALSGTPVPLFYGTTAPYRALYPGVSDGPDVTELNDNLAALGFGSGISGSDRFSAETEAAVKAWQASLGESPTGGVALGDVVVEPGPIEVDTVTASPGSTAAAGSTGTSVLTATSTTREVTIDLDADEQSDIKVGDPVTVTLPDNSTTPGVVSSVGTVATTPSSSAGNTGTSTPTITVEVTLTDPKATGDLDEATVTVSITNATASNVLAVPVEALLALSSGGYGLEEVEANGLHHLVPVTLGLFDDEAGTVQVSGSSLAAGETVVVPNT